MSELREAAQSVVDQWVTPNAEVSGADGVALDRQVGRFGATNDRQNENEAVGTGRAA